MVYEPGIGQKLLCSEHIVNKGYRTNILEEKNGTWVLVDNDKIRFE